MSEDLEDVVEEEEELEDDDRKDVLEEGVGVDGEGYGLIGGELVTQ